MTPIHVSSANVLALRLDRQRLTQPWPSGSYTECIERLIGVQAQVPGAARLAIGVRVHEAHSKDIERLFDDPSKVARGWSLRGTMHVTARAQTPWILAAIKEDVIARELHWMRQRGLESRTVIQLLDSIVKALAGADLTREQLASEVRRLSKLDRRVIDTWVMHSWGGIVKIASLEGEVECKTNGRTVVFTKSSSAMKMSKWKPPDAQDLLYRRYLFAYEPASVSDFRSWSGISASAASATNARNSELLSEVRVSGSRSLVLKEDLGYLIDSSVHGLINFLPAFDVYWLSHGASAKAALEPTLRRMIFGKAGWVFPTVLSDGDPLGTWRSIFRKGSLRVLVQLPNSVDTTTSNAIQSRAQLLGTFLDASSVGVLVVETSVR